MKKKNTFKKVLKFVHGYLLFFLLIAFVITCSMMLFLSVMMKTMGITFTSENLGTAAKLTFGNVVFLSLIISLIDYIRRKISVERPVKQIVEAAQKITQGDFSVRIKLRKNIYASERFHEIADCFNKMAQELSGTETLRTDFVANVSHELKTPLAVMQNYATLLRSPGLSEEKRIEYSKEIGAASRRLADLISNILKLNKLENQQIFPKNISFDLGEQLRESLLSFEEIWEKKNIEIETDIEEGLMMCGDAEMLSLVWNNLFSNAFKFTDNGGKVSVCVKSEGEYAFVRITDSGCGISNEVGAHIFDKFYQADTSHSVQGNGLGLALVKRVIDITKSDISVESELGKGSTFTVKLHVKDNG